MNNTPFKKRSDPFSTSFPKSEPVVEPIIEQTVVEKSVHEPVVERKPVTKTSRSKVVVREIDDANREKYTATMEKSLRRRVKIACAEEGIQFSAFIEEACLEKLEREGR